MDVALHLKSWGHSLQGRLSQALARLCEERSMSLSRTGRYGLTTALDGGLSTTPQQPERTNLLHAAQRDPSVREFGGGRSGF